MALKGTGASMPHLARLYGQNMARKWPEHGQNLVSPEQGVKTSPANARLLVGAALAAMNRFLKGNRSQFHSNRISRQR